MASLRAADELFDFKEAATRRSKVSIFDSISKSFDKGVMMLVGARGSRCDFFSCCLDQSRSLISWLATVNIVSVLKMLLLLFSVALLSCAIQLSSASREHVRSISIGCQEVSRWFWSTRLDYETSNPSPSSTLTDLGFYSRGWDLGYSTYSYIGRKSGRKQELEGFVNSCFMGKRVVIGRGLLTLPHIGTALVPSRTPVTYHCLYL